MLHSSSSHKVSSLQIMDNWPHWHHTMHCSMHNVPPKLGFLPPYLKIWVLFWPGIMNYMPSHLANWTDLFVKMLNTTPQNIVLMTLCTCLPQSNDGYTIVFNAVQMTQVEDEEFDATVSFQSIRLKMNVLLHWIHMGNNPIATLGKAVKNTWSKLTE